MDQIPIVLIECPAHPFSQLSTINYQLSLAEQLFDAVNQPSNDKRFDQILHVVLGQEQSDFRIGGETSNEDETIRQRRAHLLGFEVKLVTAQARHLQVADHGVVLMRFHLEKGCFPVKSDIDQKIFICQDPL